MSRRLIGLTLAALLWSASAVAADEDPVANPVHFLGHGGALSVAPGDGGYMAVWQSGNDVHSRRIDSQGAPSGDEVLVASSAKTAVVARMGDGFILGFTRGRDLFVERLDGEGHSSGPEVMIFGGTPSYWASGVAAIAVSGPEILVVWRSVYCCSEDTGIDRLVATPLDPMLRPGPSTSLTPGRTDDYFQDVSAASLGPDSWLLGWSEWSYGTEAPLILSSTGANPVLSGKRDDGLTAAGGGTIAYWPDWHSNLALRSLGTGGERLVDARQRGPISFDGESFVVLARSGGSLKGMFVRPDGGLITPLPVLLATSAGQWALAGSNGRALLAWADDAGDLRARVISHGDGAEDAVDDCPGVANPDQIDSDGDGVGDACEDLDADGVKFRSDDCPWDANPDQLDTDRDGIGDVCDLDDDADGIADAADDCPAVANPDQVDVDHDHVGDVCDAIVDNDGDGVANSEDDCPDAWNPDQAMICVPDTDGDGVKDPDDDCPGTRNADQSDNDGDGAGNVCDTDDDNDGVPDLVDDCLYRFNPDQLDDDGDGIGNVCDHEPGAVPRSRGGGCDVGGGMGAPVAWSLGAASIVWLHVRRRSRGS